MTLSLLKNGGVKGYEDVRPKENSSFDEKNFNQTNLSFVKLPTFILWKTDFNWKFSPSKASVK